MSHEPPVPAGNRSPFPLHEAPRAAGDGPPADAAVARTPAPERGSGALVGALVTAGIAVLAGIGAWAWATEPRYKRKERKRRKSAKR